MLRDRGFEVAGMDYDEESVELSIDNFRRSGILSYPFHMNQSGVC